MVRGCGVTEEFRCETTTIYSPDEANQQMLRSALLQDRIQQLARVSHILQFASDLGWSLSQISFFFKFINVDVPWVYRQLDTVFTCDTSPNLKWGVTH